MSGFGDSTALNLPMDNGIYALQRGVTAVRDQVASEKRLEILLLLGGPVGFVGSFFTSTADAKAAVLSSMKTIDSIIARLDGPSRQEVLAGTLEPSKWAAAAQTVAEGIQAQLKILNDETTISMMSQQFDQMKRDFEALGVKVASGMKVAMPFLIVGGIALAIFLVPVLLRGTPVGMFMRGYRD